MNFGLAIFRSIHIGSSILLAAVFAFRLIFLCPVSGSESLPDETLRSRTEELLKRVAIGSWVLLLCSGVCWLWVVAASINDEETPEAFSLTTLKTILTQTEFGHLWLVRGLFSLFVAIFIITPRNRWSGFGLAIGLEVSLTGASHSWANASAAGVFGSAFDASHLLVSVLWPGCLLPLFVFLVVYRGASTDHSREIVARILERFSRVSLAAVAVLGTTGLLNAFLLGGTLRALLASFYGHLLLFKIGFFLAMVGFGARNYFIFKPRIVLNLRKWKGKEENDYYRRLIQNVISETILLAGVLLIVGLLGVTAPPIH
jgi:putative copper resistance protein D